MSEINKNMVRERALRLPVVTDELYEQCNKETREMIQEFFDAKSQHYLLILEPNINQH